MNDDQQSACPTRSSARTGPPRCPTRRSSRSSTSTPTSTSPSTRPPRSTSRVAANANVAAPIDAAVGANVLSVGSSAQALSDQGVIINQGIDADATAHAIQDSALDQGNDAVDAGAAPRDPAAVDAADPAGGGTGAADGAVDGATGASTALRRRGRRRRRCRGGTGAATASTARSAATSAAPPAACSTATCSTSTSTSTPTPTSPPRSTARSPPTPTSRRRSTPPWRPTSARSTATRSRSSQQDAIINQDIDGLGRGRPPTSPPTSPAVAAAPMTVLDGPSTARDDASRRRVAERVPARADGVAAHRRDAGLRLPGAAGAGPARRRADDPADPAALPGARRRSTARATLDEIAAAVSAAPRARRSRRDNVRTLVDEQLRPLGLLTDGRRQPARGEASPTRCWRCASSTPSPTRSGPAGSPRRSRGCSTRVLVVAGAGRASLASAGGCCFEQGPGLGDARGLRPARAAAAGARGHRALGRLPRVRPRGRRPPRRRHARA